MIKIIYDEAFKETGRKGWLYWDAYCVPIISGPYKKGFAPPGEYELKDMVVYDLNKEPDKDRMAQFGVSFFVPLYPTFETDRTMLGNHPDGGVVGSLGCIANLHKDEMDVNFLLEKYKTLSKTKPGKNDSNGREYFGFDEPVKLIIEENLTTV